MKIFYLSRWARRHAQNKAKKTFTFQTFKTWSFHEDFFVETDAQGHISSQVCCHNLEHIVNKSRFRWGSGGGISKYGELCSFSASLGWKQEAFWNSGINSGWKWLTLTAFTILVIPLPLKKDPYACFLRNLCYYRDILSRSKLAAPKIYFIILANVILYCPLNLGYFPKKYSSWKMFIPPRCYTEIYWMCFILQN